jgi:hypothetical protein
MSSGTCGPDKAQDLAHQLNIGDVRNVFQHVLAGRQQSCHLLFEHGVLGTEDGNVPGQGVAPGDDDFCHVSMI